MQSGRAIFEARRGSRLLLEPARSSREPRHPARDGAREPRLDERCERQFVISARAQILGSRADQEREPLDRQAVILAKIGEQRASAIVLLD